MQLSHTPQRRRAKDKQNMQCDNKAGKPTRAPCSYLLRDGSGLANGLKPEAAPGRLGVGLPRLPVEVALSDN